MHSSTIISLIRESAELLRQDFNGAELQSVEAMNRHYQSAEIAEFKRDLTEAANKIRIIYLDNALSLEGFRKMIRDVHIPIIAFEKTGDLLAPVIFSRRSKKLYITRISGGIGHTDEIKAIPDLHLDRDGKVDFLGVFSYKSLVSTDPTDENPKKLTPVKRLIRLLSEDKRDILYIYIYAVLIGLISLTLPLGIQATVSLISGGVFFSSVYILIALVIFGILASGGLQVMQITLVEYLQRRVFTKAAFEFAFRVPRIKGEALRKYYAPELMNRFFDVLTIQKGLPKLLIDLSAGVIQILFGLILLSFYHPFFIFFGLILVGLLSVIFYVTGPKGLSTSIEESKYKYKVVYWLEEVARTINSFKLSGNTNLPLKKTDYNVNNYLKNRKAHFNILLGQYTYVIIFKAMVTGGLLIIGTILVVQREITLGQFVASEVIIILTLSSVEKIIMYMDVIYDMLTAVDKIANVTDLPLEKSGGIDLPGSEDEAGFSIRTKDLNYKFGRDDYGIKNINLDIRPGERVCIAGRGGAGKTVLVNTLAGLNVSYEGIITVDGYSFRNLDLNNLRDKIGKNVSQSDLFEGTILDNILLSKPHASPKDAIRVINELGIADDINKLPAGLDTLIVSGGKGFSNSMINKIILARCLVKQPKLLILNDFFDNFSKNERQQLIDMLAASKTWTLLVVSNDPLIMEKCDKVILMEQGEIIHQGSYDEIMNLGIFKNIVY